MSCSMIVVAPGAVLAVASPPMPATTMSAKTAATTSSTATASCSDGLTWATTGCGSCVRAASGY